ncbi:AAA family ATPase [Parvibaculum sp.]|uniref:AAA family ATPase n=1 Tax=Parvibaculum sp. TaxID=2024848 RepID=UPI001D69DDAE|nr:AAA family ATPase [Parvibaculum sp.]MBX3488577.1 chromosome segregation protein SMC [Parvibaculum sp.]
MAEATFSIRRLELRAFRAYLAPAQFDFGEKKCLAILGPNRHGKTSMIDGLEFLFSDDGTLERLGSRTAQTKAGPIALAHNGAEAAKVKPEVLIELLQVGKTTKAARAASGSKRPRPAEITALKTALVVDPIIRGYNLRFFVEQQTPEDRYTSVAAWLKLSPLVEVQKNLRALRTTVKSEAEDTKSVERLNAALKKATDSAVSAWNEAAVVVYINTMQLAPLDKTLTMEAIVADDAGYNALVERVAAEEKQLGLSALKQIKSAAEKLYQADDEAAGAALTGLIPDFETATTKAAEAGIREQEERGIAKDVIFKSAWEAAKPLFESDKPPETCPICETPIAKSAAGSPSIIQQHISAHLADLTAYASANSALEKAKSALGKIKDRMEASLEMLIELCAETHPITMQTLKDYRGAVNIWTEGATPDSAPARAQLLEMQVELKTTIDEIEARQGDHTFAKAKAKVDALIELAAEFRQAARVTDELGTLSADLTAQAAQVSAAIRAKVQALLDLLQKPMNEIFALIQGGDAPPVRLELPKEDETNQHRLALLVDFAKNRLGVQPSGYFSDSQIHSVALALRLAAILAFNSRAPIVILDDIVTSYDVDHRRSIVQMLAQKFAKHQVVITTHDERFFHYLKDILVDKDWKYRRITGLDPSFGPRFSDHKVTDEMIEARWANGDSAANEMRQSEEEFLLTLARDFGVNVRIRPLERPYNYDRSELASSIAAFLKSRDLTPPLVPGVNNRFLNSLQKGAVENFGSHFSDDPGAYSSIGDEKARWAELGQFRSYFVCPKCGGTRFQRPIQVSKPLCAAEKCEAQFAFPETEASTAATA